MAITVRQLAELVGGVVVGDAGRAIQSARTLDEAQADDITFIEKRNFVARLNASKADAAVAPMDLNVPGKTLIQVADPLMAFVTIVQHLQGKTAPAPTGIHPTALVHPSAVIGADPSIAANVHVGANTTIGNRCRLNPGVVVGNNCKIGDDATLYPHVVLYDDTSLGDRVIIHANAVLGADGFGYRFQQGRHVKVPQLGTVVIGNDVEIGAGSCVDRGAFGSTVIGDGTKIDNLVQIAHNCQIGKHNVIAAQGGIAGSSSTGNYVGMGGQAGISDHVKVGDAVMIGAKTGVFRDVPARQRMFLYPAFEERDAARIVACLRRLPSMRRDLLHILKELDLQTVDDVPEEARKAG